MHSFTCTRHLSHLRGSQLFVGVLLLRRQVTDKSATEKSEIYRWPARFISMEVRQIGPGRKHGVTWRHRACDHLIPPYSISYRCFIVTDSISSRFRDIRPYIYWGHDLDLSRSRDVIGYVTIRLPIPLFLLVPHYDQTCISKSFRDIVFQSACPVQIVIAHARYHVACTPYAKFGYIFEFPTPTLPIHCDTFIGLRWRLRGVYPPK